MARTPGTHTQKAMGGDAGWTLDQHLTALVYDQLALANWQRQGKKGAPRPKPLSPLHQPEGEERTGNTAGRSDQEVAALLENYRTGVFDGS